MVKNAANVSPCLYEGFESNRRDGRYTNKAEIHSRNVVPVLA